MQKDVKLDHWRNFSVMENYGISRVERKQLKLLPGKNLVGDILMLHQRVFSVASVRFIDSRCLCYYGSIFS